MAETPFDLLLDIEKACKTYARPLPWQQEIGQSWQGIGFICNDIHFVTPLSEIIEVLPLPQITSLPTSVSWFKGVANLRNQLIPITDLQAFSMGNLLQTTPLSRVLVVEFEKTGVGFLVSKVFGVQHFLKKDLKPVSGDNSKFAPFLQGSFKEGQTDWKVLSLKAITQTAQFYHIVQEAAG